MDIITWDGKPIGRAGLFKDIPIDAYHRRLTIAPSISSSGLRTIFDASPAHYFVDSYLNPNRLEDGESDALILGKAAHHLLLGESLFHEKFAIRPEKWDSWRTNDAKTWRAQQQIDGRTVIDPKHIDTIRGMAESLARNSIVRAGILNGLIEHSMVFEDAETGVWLKSRPDSIPTASADFGDFKTTVSVGRDAIERTVADYTYFVQGALVGMASKAVLGLTMASFSLVFVEKTPPFCCRVVTLKEADLELGARIIRASLRVFADCLEKGDWPGPGDQSDASYVEIPPWARTRFETRVTLMEQGILV